MQTSASLEVDDLDPKIRKIVELLREQGVETYASCQGGTGHPYPVPTVRFHGERGEGFRALAIALQYRLMARRLRRVWRIIDGEPDGPTWEMTFDLRD